MKFKIREMVIKEFVKTPWRKELLYIFSIKDFLLRP